MHIEQLQPIKSVDISPAGKQPQNTGANITHANKLNKIHMKGNPVRKTQK